MRAAILLLATAAIADARLWVRGTECDAVCATLEQLSAGPCGDGEVDACRAECKSDGSAKVAECSQCLATQHDDKAESAKLFAANFKAFCGGNAVPFFRASPPAAGESATLIMAPSANGFAATGLITATAAAGGASDADHTALISNSGPAPSLVLGSAVAHGSGLAGSIGGPSASATGGAAAVRAPVLGAAVAAVVLALL